MQRAVTLTRTVWFILFVAAVAQLAGCTTVAGKHSVEKAGSAGVSALSATSHIPPAQLQALLHTTFNDAKSAVAGFTGVNLSRILMTLADADQVTHLIRSSLDESLANDLPDKTLRSRLINDMATDQASSVLALYSPGQKAILIQPDNVKKYLSQSNSRSQQRKAVLALFVHELLHAADDYRYNAFGGNDATYAEKVARSAVIEGHAQLQTRRLCLKLHCNAAFNRLNRYMFARTEIDSRALAYHQNRHLQNLEFIYKEGERFVSALSARTNSRTNSQTCLLYTSPSPRDS